MNRVVRFIHTSGILFSSPGTWGNITERLSQNIQRPFRLRLNRGIIVSSLRMSSGRGVVKKPQATVTSVASAAASLTRNTDSEHHLTTLTSLDLHSLYGKLRT